MKRRTGVLIALLSAVATFGTLRITLGPRHFTHWHGKEVCHQPTEVKDNAK